MNKHLNAIRKAGFGSLFTPTKAMRRVRAIAADRTRASLTGGCSGPGIFRIYTEFCSAEGEPGRLGQPGLATSASERPQGSQGSGKPRHSAWGSGCAGRYGAGRGFARPRRNRAANARSPGGLFDRGRGRRRRDLHRSLLRIRRAGKSAASKSSCRASALRSTWRARNSPGSVDASHCSFTALAHNSRRGGAALLIRTSAEIEQPHRVTPA